MNKKLNKTISTLLIGGGLMLGATGCTDNFEDYNTNPMEPTPDQMEGDFAATATLISNMIPTIAQGQENNYQMLDQMIGCEYGHMTAALNQWGTDMYFGTYNPPTGWSGTVFDTTMPQIYTPFFKIRDISGENSLVYHWANLLRIFGSLRVSDCYGPIPFSKIGSGSDFTVEYDDMPTLYNAMFDELDKAISGLKESVGSTTTATLFGDVDYVYGGDIAKWVKFANTLKLRMALRLVNVNPTLAQQKAEEAANDPSGLIESSADAAWSTFTPGGNALHKVSELWGEGRISADITAYMTGYNDPRLAAYAKANGNGDYIGARNGVYHFDRGSFGKYSAPNADATSALLSISASESWFSRAEGALRGWNMGGKSAKELYEKGITVSMEERKVAIGNYLSSTATPADYTAIDNTSHNTTAASSITPKYDEADGFEKNLERIMVQKWLGNFPNGWETWSDFRRTGYPKFFPVVDNRSTDGVSSTRGARRLPYPQSEFNTNEANVKAAQAMLGGADNMATDLWWAKKD